MANTTEVSRAEILSELQAYREQLEGVSIGGLRASKHSQWSAHGRWSSSSARLPGDVEVRSGLSVSNQPVVAAQLDQLLKDASSSNLIGVAERLSKQLGG